MQNSPRQALLVRPRLYRNRLCAVIFAAAATIACVYPGARLLHAQGLTQQFGRKPVSKGPRALGIVQISKTGKARLTPIAILMDGKFFDAGSYKAAPVPMALDFGVVYEGFRSGVSEGLFTITQPGQLGHNWIAEGTWLPEGAKPKETTRKYAAPVIEEDNKDDRPVMHRRAAGAADKDEAKKDEPKPAAGSTTSSTSTPSSAPSAAPASAPSTSTPSTTTTSASTPASTETPKAESQKPKPESRERASKTSDLDEPINDPNRPILRRGKPDPNAHHEPFVTFDDLAEQTKPGTEQTKGAKDSSGKDAASVLTIAAISDAAGPDPRPYNYDVKPAEEATYRSRMLDLAAKLLQPSTAGAANTTATGAVPGNASAPHKKASASKNKSAPANPKFDDVTLRIFDLSNSNEPVLVLTARTPKPPAGAVGSVQEPQEITLIARTNLENELQKLFFAQTDSHHLDVSPRMELIDAVDADGDGRGELLFRQTSDAGSVYAIYRVAADRLWKLFEGAP